MRLSLAFALVASVLTTACSGGAACVAGATAACVCPTGGPGVQTCNVHGTFDVCTCTGGMDGGSVDGGGHDASPPDAPGADLSADLGPDMCADADGDGHASIACGGDDCDDTDADRYPGNAEVCDSTGHDEDCNPATLGPDHDGDGTPSITCCDRQLSGVLLCGTDCNDSSMDISPTAPEVCDGVDDNCNGMVDEGVMTSYYPDCDRDGFGGVGTTPLDGCGAPAISPAACAGGGWSTAATDCMDLVAAVHPGAIEICANGVDDDCNGAIDDGTGRTYYADCDHDGHGDPSQHVMNPGCGAPAAPPTCGAGTGMWSTSSDDCNDAAAAVHPTAIELCNGVDDDCDGTVDGATATCVGVLPLHTMMAACTGVGVCTPTVCDAPYLDCSAAAGCESNPLTDAANCGSCGRGCLRAPSCGGGLCLADFVQISSGYDTTCGVRGSGSVACWGANTSGQLGDGTMTERHVPTAVVGLSGALEVAAGNGFACARLATSVVCWGAGSFGVLGDGVSTDRSMPGAAVSGLANAVQIAVGWTTACAVRSSGAVACWGQGGSVGDGTSMARNVATAVTGLTDAVEVAVGGEGFACARRSTGAVVCWGVNGHGELGDGTTMNALAPTPVSGLSDAVQLSAGFTHVCARRASGAVVCWGDNTYGEAGAAGPPFTVMAPSPVAGVADAVDVSAGADFTCAVRASGGVVCWGSLPPAFSGDSTPVAVAGISGAVEVKAGWHHTCARRSDDQVLCWGQNFAGELGDGTRTDRDSAAPITDP